MRIEVTQQDINEGDHVNCYACPVALALLRQTRVRWGVAGSFATASDNRGAYHVRLPKEVQLFVRRFDGYDSVVPFAFEFDWEPTRKGKRE